MAETSGELNARLIIRHAFRVVAIVELKGKSLSLGRWDQCDIVLPHDAVSRLHARFVQGADGWHVTDLNSVNGLQVNGQRVATARLTPGDVIDIRPYAINFVTDESHGGDQAMTLADTRIRHTRSFDREQAGVVAKQRLEDLYAMSRLVLRHMDEGAFWQEVHAALQRSLQADRCFLIGLDDEAGIFRLAPHGQVSGTVRPLEISRTVLNQVIASSNGMLIQQVTKDDRFAGAGSLMLGNVGSVICTPIVISETVRAIVYADRRATQSPFNDDDLGFSVVATELVATALEREELSAKAQELARLEGRIEEGRRIQTLLFPSPIPQPPWGSVAARNDPADQMSGDTYDVVMDPAGRLIVSIADVVGKGVPAAFLTGVIQTTLRQSLLSVEDLAEIAHRLNAAVYDNTSSEGFATMVVCRWSASGDSVEIANAGHPAPLWVAAPDKVEGAPECVGIALGILPKWTGEIIRLDTRDPFVLLLSSDGATEATDGTGKQFGLTRLGDELLRLRGDSPQAIVDGLAEAVREFAAPNAPGDDITLVTVKKQGGLGSTEAEAQASPAGMG